MRTKAQQIEIGGVSLMVFGNHEAIRRKGKLGLFCSVKCPGNLILKAYKFSREARDSQKVIVSGFQSPIEKDCLRTLLRGDVPIIICLARRITTSRLSREWQSSMKAGRLLLVSPFSEAQKRVTADLAFERNRFVVSLADEVLIVYAHPGSKTEALASEVLGAGKRVYTFSDGANEKLIEAGAVPVEPEFFAAKQLEKERL